MTFGQGPRLRGAAIFSTLAPGASRRALYAFGLGLAISVAGLAAFAAGARGNFAPPDLSAFVEAAPSSAQRSNHERITFVHYNEYSAHRSRSDDDEDARPRHRHHGLHASVIHFAASTPSFTGSQPVCVRLCDGFFFPLPTAASDVASQGAACNSLCPDAPTEVYYRNGAEDIGNAISPSGKLYSALPVSMRYRASSDQTCSCHRDPVAYAPLKDTTLRHGDAIMTPAGFMVFRGVEGIPHGTRDFTALDGAGLGSSARGALKAMERASLVSVHPTLKDWLLSQNTGPGFGPQAAAKAPVQGTFTTANAAAGGGKIRLMTWRGRDE